jgi:hypothetical protein
MTVQRSIIWMREVHSGGAGVGGPWRGAQLRDVLGVRGLLTRVRFRFALLQLVEQDGVHCTPVVEGYEYVLPAVVLSDFGSGGSMGILIPSSGGYDAALTPAQNRLNAALSSQRQVVESSYAGPNHLKQRMHHSYTDDPVLASLVIRVGFALFNLKLGKGAVAIPSRRINSTQELRVDGQPFDDWAAAWEAAPELKYAESLLSATSTVAVRTMLVEYVRHIREINAGVQTSKWCSIHIYDVVRNLANPTWRCNCPISSFAHKLWHLMTMMWDNRHYPCLLTRARFHKTRSVQVTEAVCMRYPSRMWENPDLPRRTRVISRTSLPPALVVRGFQ